MGTAARRAPTSAEARRRRRSRSRHGLRPRAPAGPLPPRTPGTGTRRCADAPARPAAEADGAGAAPPLTGRAPKPSGPRRIPDLAERAGDEALDHVRADGALLRTACRSPQRGGVGRCCGISQSAAGLPERHRFPPVEDLPSRSLGGHRARVPAGRKLSSQPLTATMGRRPGLGQGSQSLGSAHCREAKDVKGDRSERKPRPRTRFLHRGGSCPARTHQRGAATRHPNKHPRTPARPNLSHIWTMCVAGETPADQSFPRRNKAAERQDGESS